MVPILKSRKELTGEQVSLLKDTADVIYIEQRIFEEGMGSSRIFTLENFYQMLEQVKQIRRGIAIKPKDKNLRNPEEDFTRRMVKPLHKGDLIRETLEFVRELDEDLYQRVLKFVITMDESEDITIRSKYATQLTKPEYKKYSISRSPCSSVSKGERTVFLGLHNDYSEEKARKTSKAFPIDDFCVYKNVSTCIHEIAHGFDMDMEKEKSQYLNNMVTRLRGEANAIPNVIDKMVLFLRHKQNVLNQNDINITDKEREKILDTNIARLYLCEATTIFCEYVYADFLLEKNPELGRIALQTNYDRICKIGGNIDRLHFLSKLGIEREQVKKLDEDFLIQLVTKENVTDSQLEKIEEKLPTMHKSRRYVLADILVPSMIETYNKDKEEGKKRYQRYLQCIKNNDFEGALNAFEIDIYSKEGVEQIMRNYKKNLAKYFPQYHDKEEER